MEGEAEASADGGAVPAEAWRKSFARFIDRHRFPEGYRNLFLAAIETFAEQGFHGTTTRQIAAGAGLSPAALYAHFASKEDVLYAIARSALDLSAQLVTEQERQESTPTGKLVTVVRSLSAWNAHHLPVARVVLHQLDALSPAHLAQVAARRRVVDRLVRGIIADGIASGEFDVTDVRESAIAVLSLCLDVARWYRPGGAYGPEQIGERNAATALRIVGARESGVLHFSCDAADGPELGFEARIAAAIADRARILGAPLIGRDGLLTGVNREVLQTALDAELDEHLRSGAVGRAPGVQANMRNGSSPKTVRTELGEVELRVPRDRDGTFDPVTVPRRARSLAGFDEAVVSLYAKGLSLGAIQDHLAQVYGVEVSRSLISRLTDQAAEQTAAHLTGPLESGYPVIRVIGVRAKVRGHADGQAVHVAVGFTVDGRRDLVGLWADADGEDEAFWRRALGELKSRGIEDTLVVFAPEALGLAAAAAGTWPSTGADKAAVIRAAITSSTPDAVLQRAVDRHGTSPDLKTAEKVLVLSAAETLFRSVL